MKILYNISKNSLDMNHPCKSQLLDNETLRCRVRNPSLRFVKALLKIDDPEVEQALAVILGPAGGSPSGGERHAAAVAREPARRAAAGLI
ncbi:hypothetical protein [Bradyrhizobium sp. Ash2021]|uniref:hypothetical protein n=1 Tax=Bradyrhizobium sp. Ash2021 TaxID=2954771 RepID=UPI002814EB9E|nr:hypothetical protein [Bradyrhizobium sp. Ash2021]WMT73719.1 hypothetical protein NL528_38255 [Bradyrhizobium sp. Ash2021]